MFSFSSASFPSSTQRCSSGSWNWMSCIGFCTCFAHGLSFSFLKAIVAFRGLVSGGGVLHWVLFFAAYGFGCRDFCFLQRMVRIVFSCHVLVFLLWCTHDVFSLFPSAWTVASLLGLGIRCLALMRSSHGLGVALSARFRICGLLVGDLALVFWE